MNHHSDVPLAISLIIATMYWQYLLVFIGAFLFDVVPFPLPPAFVIMVILQVAFGLNIWLVILLGVAGSILGRYILTLYIPFLAGKIFKPEKNEDVQFLGRKMKENVWKSQLFIIAYSLLPMPTTPLFIAGGMAKLKPIFIIPSFFLGKFISDTVAVYLGEYALINAESIISGSILWKSLSGVIAGVLLLCALLFIDWRSWIQKNEIQLKFKIWR